MALELLLDNETWTDAEDAARAIPWPKCNGFLSVRWFLVIQGGVDVSRAIGILAAHPEANAQLLEELLVSDGYSSIDARRIVTLVPIAFGEMILGLLKVKQPFGYLVDNGKIRAAIDLTSSPVFQQAKAIVANPQLGLSMDREQILGIAARDASFKAVNNALHAGSEPKNLRISPPVISGKKASRSVRRAGSSLPPGANAGAGSSVDPSDDTVGCDRSRPLASCAAH